MAASSPTAAPHLSRRGFLAASAAGLALLSAGCTSEPTPEREPVTAAQVDGLAEQIDAQAALVDAYAAAAGADPALAADVTELATQAGDQLVRLQAAAPGARPSPTSAAGSSGSGSTGSGSSGSPSGSSAAMGGDTRKWLRAQVVDTAASHAAACLEQSGARAALLGSIAAGLRGQATVLS